jgi:hypothetical protein
LPDYFLFLVFCYSTFFNALVGNAQQSFTPANLENTEWGATASDYYASYARSPVTVLYQFGAQRTVKVLVSFLYAPPPQTTVDPATGQWKTTYFLPAIQSKEDVNGTYRRTGSSIRIEFSDHIINATIDANRMSGEVIDKSNSQKTNWGAERISSRSGNQPVSSNSPVAVDRSIALTESKRDLSGYITGVPKSRPNTVRSEDWTLRPASGYQWIDPEDIHNFDVEIMPGLIKTENGFRLEKGYGWANPRDPKDYRVEPIP